MSPRTVRSARSARSAGSARAALAAVAALPFSLVVALLMAFAIPGPCAFDAHPELDCADGTPCPQGLACASDGHCKDASIACDDVAGAVACDGLCVDGAAFQSDSTDCGSCGRQCAANEACCAGICDAIDTAGRCGSCDVSCNAGAGEVCLDAACAGTCTVDADCPGGHRCCDDRCRDVTRDDRCGTCNVACATGSETCVDESCRAHCTVDGDCGGGGHCCDGTCAPADDAANCGGCGVPCGAHEVCLNDTCAPECAPGRDCADASRTCCSGTCVDTTVDDAHCSSCTISCNGASFCHDSTCHDGTERTCCGPQCHDCSGQNDRCNFGQCVACDMFAQDCGAGAGCVPAFPQRVPPAGACLPAAPAPAPGQDEPCAPTAASTDCDDGFDCQPVNADVDLCVRYCNVQNPQECVASAEQCFPAVPNTNLGICVPRCDLSSDHTCTVGGSGASGVAGTCVPLFVGICVGATEGACAAAGPVGEGATCGGIADCAAGLVCAPSTNTCLRLCDGVGSACAGSGTCTNEFSCTEMGVCQ